MTRLIAVPPPLAAPLLVATVLAAALTFAASASARTFVVTKQGDPAPASCTKKDCSLREAVIAANANPGRDVIELPRVRRRYVLAQPGTGEDAALTGDLDITRPVTIRHSGRGKAKIEGRRIDRVLDIHTGAPTTLRKIVIRRGDNPDATEGGGIRSAANLSLIGSRVVANRAAAAGGGIGLVDDAGLQLDRSQVVNNRALNGDGGGIDGADGALVIRSSLIRGNSAGGGSAGGGIYHHSADPSRIVDSTIRDNRAGGRSGGLSVSASGGSPPLRVIRTTISGNRADDSGGGLSAFSALVVTRSTVSGNRAGGSGGGLYATGARVSIVNSTFAENRADGAGGGIYARDDARLSLNAVTVARNLANATETGPLVELNGGGLFSLGADGFDVRNSLISLNRVGASGRERNDCAGTTPITSRGNNLLSRAAGCDGFGPPVSSDIIGGNGRIGKLRRNGGPTQTIALLPRSPAIGAANRKTAPKRDQRGRKRGHKKDIGAFELGVRR